MLPNMYILILIQYTAFLIHDPMPIGRCNLYGIGDKSSFPDSDGSLVFDIQARPSIPTRIDLCRIPDNNQSSFSIKSKGAVQNDTVVSDNDTATTFRDKNATTPHSTIPTHSSLHMMNSATKHKRGFLKGITANPPNTSRMKELHIESILFKRRLFR